MRNIRVLAMLVWVVVLSGCAITAGSSRVNDIGRYLSLQKGESTKRDVYGVFGQPYDVQDGSSTWVYYSVKFTTNVPTLIPFVGLIAGGSDVDTTAAKIQFNSNERVSGIETGTESSYL